jgi:demethoxyubiquinone hydroxylase (CLK1/Coq7/Cat5 family)
VIVGVLKINHVGTAHGMEQINVVNRIDRSFELKNVQVYHGQQKTVRFQELKEHDLPETRFNVEGHKQGVFFREPRIKRIRTDITYGPGV